MDGVCGSTKTWKNMEKGYAGVALRTAQRQDLWNFQHGCSMKNVAEGWRFAALHESITRRYSESASY
jgi:hypothetical protein